MNQTQLHPSNNLTDIRRFHKKSRTGCARCKRRRIKCDEQKPSCKNCERHQLECSLEFLTPLTFRSRKSPASASKRQEPNSQIMSPRLPLPKVSLALSLPTSTHNPQTKELLHHYASALYSSVGENCSPTIWNDTIPRLSLIYPFVLPAMLALSALHLASLVPARRSQLQHISLAHESSALPSFRELMGRLTPSSTLVHTPPHALPSHKQSGSPSPSLTPPPITETNPHIHALFACASHISYFVVASPTPPGIDRCRIPSRNDTYPHWFQSMRGFMALLDNHWLQLANGPLGSTISRERVPEIYLLEHPDDVQLRGLLGMFACGDEQGDEEVAVEGNDAVLKEAISYLRRVFAVTNLPIPKARLAGRTWAGTVSQAYAELVYSRDPRALVILAHYCVLLKRLHDVWYMEGLGVGLLENIRKELGREWQPWIEWPLEQPMMVNVG